MSLPMSTSRQAFFPLIPSNSLTNSLSDTKITLSRRSSNTPSSRLKNRLDEAWLRAEKKFNEDTKKSLGSYDVRSKDSIVKQLKQKYEADSKDGIRHVLQTDTLERILNGVELVGAFAAQGVNIIFGPANLCFNAIAFLIDAPRQLAKVFDELQMLLEEMERFLIRFRIYRRIEDAVGLANEMCEDTNLLLISFVKVCGVAVKILQSSRWDAIKYGASVVLVKDDRVAMAMEEFKTLCHSSSALANTVMLEHVLNSEADVKQILSAARRLEVGMGLLIARSNDEKTRIVNKDHLRRIQRTLFFRPPSEDFLVPSNQENGLETLRALESTEEYDHWLNSPDIARCMLVLWGPLGSGKSYMLDTIKDNLNVRRECAGRGESSIYVAVHDFNDADSKSPKDQMIVSPIADILKKIAFQVAVQSTTYAKKLATVLSIYPQLRAERDLNKVWKSLKLLEVGALSGATMYLLLDSVEKRHLQGDLRKLVDLLMETRSKQSGKGLKLRIVLATNVKPDLPKSSSYLSIPIHRINRKLVAAFVGEEMRRKDIFQDVDKETMTLRQEIITKLMVAPPDMTFTDIQQRLTALKEAISTDQPYSEITHILDRKGDQKFLDSGTDIIQEIQTQLSRRSVTLLNDILSFLLYAPDGCLSLEVLEAGLRLGDFELPIEPLIKKIRQQYNRILDVDRDTIFVQPSVIKALRSTCSTVSDTHVCEIREPSISMSIQINDASERAVKKFVWDLNQQMSSGNFDFSAASTMAYTHKICVDGLQAQLTIISLCFKVISEGWDEKTKPMLAYSCVYLPHHLACLQEIAPKVDDTNRRMIGEGLITYLTDPYHVKSKHESYGFGQWMHEDRAVHAIRFWLELSSQYLPLREQRWVKKSIDRSRGRLGFLQDLAGSLGEYWLTDPKSKCYPLYSWLNTYIEKNTPLATSLSGTESRKSLKNLEKGAVFLTDLFPANSGFIAPLVKSESDNSIKTITTRGGEEVPVVYKIQRAVAWVVSHTQVVPCDSLFLALGNTCLAVEDWTMALECYKKIYPEYANKHYALLGSAFCKLALGDVSSGLVAAREAFAIFHKLADQNKLWDDDLDYYLSGLKQVGEQFEALKQLPEALSFYEEALSRKPNDAVIHWKVLMLCCQTDDIQGNAYEQLSDWAEDSEHFGSTNPAVSILEMAGGSEFDTLLLPLCRAMRNLYLQNLFIHIVEDAIQLAGCSSETVVLVRLRYLQGTVFSLSSETGSSFSAIQTWRDVLHSASEETASTWGVSHLMTAAADNALRSEFDNLRSRFLSDISLTNEEKYQLYLDFNETYNGTLSTCPVLLNHHGIDSGENYVVSLCSMIDKSEARQMYQKDMAQALEILTDNDSNNDAAGIYILTRIFCTLGDEVGALSAFSLYDRNITRRRFKEQRQSPEPEWTMRDRIATGSLRNCTICSKTVYSSDTEGIWWCRFCPTFELCGGCKKKYETGKIRHERCSQLHVPSYVHLVHSNYTQEELTGSKVRIDWDMVDDGRGRLIRTGGRTVELEDWVEELRVLWELPEPHGEGSRAQQ